MLPSPLLEAVFDQSPIPAYVLAPTPEATILAVNDAFLANIGRTRGELVGRSLFEVFPADPDDAADTGEASLRRSIAEAIATGRAQSMPAQRYPIARRMDDGTVRYEERYWNATNAPVFNADGRIACILHTTIEVTRQVAAERALHAREQEARNAAQLAEGRRRRLEAVLNAAPIGLIVSDADGGVRRTNAAHDALWGLPQPHTSDIGDFSAWRGHWADAGPRAGQPVAPHEWPTARVLRGEPAQGDLIEIIRFDDPGATRICLISAAAVTDDDGHPVGAVTAEMDITDQVRAERALKEADRRKDEFLAMLAHELRNPLAPIGAAADLLAFGEADAERVRETSAIIARQVRHMTGLVDDLLDVSRVTRGLIRLEKQRLDAKRVIADAVEQARPLIEQRGHRITVRLPPEPAIVFGDAKRLVQVVTNLLTNAAKYTPERGAIDVDVAFDDAHVRITVTDNGIGMEPELLAHVFELFAQGERPVDRSQGGLGIGLALVQRLLELHGGVITASSAGPGRGSRFTVCLPKLEVERTDRQADAPLTASADGGHALRVLVVDDNDDAARVLAMFVEMIGHRATVEHSSLDALERARRERPEVCLLDIGLPDMDGIELARRLRAQPETADATLVAITGYGQEQDRANALDAGFDHHFVKPVDTARLAEVLQHASH